MKSGKVVRSKLDFRIAAKPGESQLHCVRDPDIFKQQASKRERRAGRV
jgi:hypothetical protein